MSAWTRQTDLSVTLGNQRTELWEYRQDGRALVSFPMSVTLGKPLDVLGLKGTSLDDIREYAAFLQNTADGLYAKDSNFTVVHNCPCCDKSTEDAILEFTIFGIPYHRCEQCHHVFIMKQPRDEDLDRHFEVSEEHSAPYVDPATVEIRLEQVIKPKVDWVRESFRNYFGRDIRSGLDVGAGGGHFVEGLRRAGIRADGYELSRSSRRFAKTSFDIDLLSHDFLEVEPDKGKYDLITFWGLLEYTPQPKHFLQAAHNWLRQANSMLVIEVPRFDCLGTAIQKEFPAMVARHLDPTSHVNCFSDSSLATALYNSGFKPVAAWYFGMDIYESLIQLSIHSHADLIEKFAYLIPSLQAGMDKAQWSDDLVVAAVPME